MCSVPYRFYFYVINKFFILQIVRVLGSKLEKAFKDPIEEIKQEFGLIEENFFEIEELEYLG